MAKSIFSTLQSLFSITDEQAMWRVQMQDDAEAFALLMQRHEGAIHSLCTRMVGNAQRGEDLTQEAFTRLYAKRKLYQPTAKVSTYLWRIALNLCYDELRKLKRRGEVSLDQEPDEGPSLLDLQADDQPGPHEAVEDDERAAIVRRALQELPEAYRSVVILRHYEDLKFREIADVLEIPEGTVKSRMAEAMTILSRKLRRALAEPEIEPTRKQQPEAMMI